MFRHHFPTRLDCFPNCAGSVSNLFISMQTCIANQAVLNLELDELRAAISSAEHGIQNLPADDGLPEMLVALQVSARLEIVSYSCKLSRAYHSKLNMRLVHVSNDTLPILLLTDFYLCLSLC